MLDNTCLPPKYTTAQSIHSPIVWTLFLRTSTANPAFFCENMIGERREKRKKSSPCQFVLCRPWDRVWPFGFALSSCFVHNINAPSANASSFIVSHTATGYRHPRSCSGVLRTQNFWYQYWHAHFAHCQKCIRYPNIYLPGPFNFIFLQILSLLFNLLSFGLMQFPARVRRRKKEKEKKVTLLIVTRDFSRFSR